MNRSRFVQGVGAAVLTLCAVSLAGCSGGEPVQTEADKQAQREYQKVQIAANNAAARAANPTHAVRRRRR